MAVQIAIFNIYKYKIVFDSHMQERAYVHIFG